MAFDVKIDIISLHKPLPLYLDKNNELQNLEFGFYIRIDLIKSDLVTVNDIPKFLKT